MNKLMVSIAAGLLGMATSAMAADMQVKAPKKAAEVSPWDIAFGGALMSDYNFRGISQSDRGPSTTAYVETRYTVNPSLQLYAGSQYWAVDLPTHPSCECDFYAGLRPTVGPLAFDFGFIYYWYARERQVFTDAGFNITRFQPVGGGKAVTPNGGLDYWEVYGKVTWDTIKDKLALGANFYYSPDWLNSGASGFYASGTAKITLPSFTSPFVLVGPKEVGWYISGEVGHYSFGNADNFPGQGVFKLADYWTWNAGVAFTQGVFTLDLRYYDTDLSKANCLLDTSDLRGLGDGTSPGQSKWCGSAFVVATKFDLTVLTNTK